MGSSRFDTPQLLFGEEDFVVLTGVEGWVEVNEVDGL